MNKDSLAIAVVAALITLGLAACSEPDRPANPQAPTTPAAAGASVPQPAAPVGVAPTEIQLDERKLPLKPAKRCNLERANGTVFSGTPIEVSKSVPVLKFSGWVANSDSSSIPTDAHIRMVSIDDNRAWKVPFKTGGSRDDVVKLLGGDTAFANAGYSVNVDISNLPTGTYRLYAVFQEAGSLQACDNGRSVAVR